MKGCNKGRASKDMSARQGLRPIETDLRQAMQRLATGRTDEKLNERFGISYNSWRKIMAGQPVRISLAKRLAARPTCSSAACTRGSRAAAALSSPRP